MSNDHHDRYPIPAAPASIELRIANSRFIGNAAHTPTVITAKAFIADIRAAMPTATHHVFAYLVGYGSSVTAGASDDGEPSGTAGRPVLAVLRGSGLGDVTLVVTRYFGGTKLGTGGLVRAYSDTAKATLDVVPHTERVERTTLLVTVGYGDYTAVAALLAAAEGIIAAETFAVDVTLQVALPSTAVAQVQADLATATAGQAHVTPVPLGHATNRRPD